LRTWTKGSDDDVRTGLLGFISVFMGDVIVDGITVRKTADGRITLSFPERRDRLGRRHPIVRPVDDAARRAIEKAILGTAIITEAVDQ
jgi:DNA-binding cell septation regulator SpoVG